MSPTGVWAAVGYSDGTVELVPISGERFGVRKVLNVADGAPVAAAGIHPMVTALLFTPDGSTLVSGWSDGRLQYFESRTGTAGPIFGDRFDSVREYHRLGVLAAAFNSDGSQFVSSHGGGVVRLWNAKDSFRPEMSFSADGDVNSLAFSPGDSTLVYAASRDGIIRARSLTHPDGASVSIGAVSAPNGSWTAVAFAGKKGVFGSSAIRGCAPPSRPGVSQ